MDQIVPTLHTVADFRARAALQTGDDPDADHGDHTLNPALAHLIRREGLKRAAVLIGVVDRPGEATVLLTKRADRLRSHSGQVAFPGGVIDPEDGTPEIAALREAEEEIGLDRGFVDIAGRMPDYITGSGYRIAPVLAVVDPAFRLTLNPEEVDDAFETPLSMLMNPGNHRRESRIWQDHERFFYTLPHDKHRIWGVTAGIIRTMYERLYA